LVILSRKKITIIKKRKKLLEDVVVRDVDKTQVFENGFVTIRTVFKEEADYLWDLYQHEDEWREIDELVRQYQGQFKEGATEEARQIANAAGTELLNRFQPLFKKYVILLKNGQINFHNSEQRQFVRLFIQELHLQKALSRKNPGRDYCEQITARFNFLIEGYGHQDEEEIYDDMRVIFFMLVKRYKDVGRSFCCYVYNVFKYEVCRHIQKYQRNPANFHYKIAELEDNCKTVMDDYSSIEDVVYEDDQGLPDMTWIRGDTCSEIFQQFTDEERLIFSKYYLQDWNDSQIAQLLGMHINTANQRRKSITRRLCKTLGFDPKDIVRHRKSGKKAILNTEVA